jgi:hypothetical protein
MAFCFKTIVTSSVLAQKRGFVQTLNAGLDLYKASNDRFNKYTHANAEASRTAAPAQSQFASGLHSSTAAIVPALLDSPIARAVA